MREKAFRVLVADGENAIRTRVVHMLRRAGYEPAEATDGQDAIEQSDAHRFDALVLDLVMPRVDGFGVVNHLIETQPCMIEKTVVVMTAYRNPRQRKAAPPLLRDLEAVRRAGAASTRCGVRPR